MAKERLKYDYAVALPNETITNISHISRPGLVTSTSPAGAVSHLLGRRVNQGLSGEFKSYAISNAMHILRDNHGKLDKYTTDLETAAIETSLVKHKGPLIELEEISFENINSQDLAENLAKKLGRTPQEYLGIATRYLKDNQQPY